MASLLWKKLVEGYPLPSETGIEVTVAELVVVRSFGDPIYPALMPVDRVARGGPHKPWHMLINADNFHALQLLLYAYEGKVDLIYIDPPYNTGARDWKYNNDYVDKKDLVSALQMAFDDQEAIATGKTTFEAGRGSDCDD